MQREYIFHLQSNIEIFTIRLNNYKSSLAFIFQLYGTSIFIFWTQIATEAVFLGQPAPQMSRHNIKKPMVF